MTQITIQDSNLYYKTADVEYRIRGFEDVLLSHLRVNIKVSFKGEFFIDIVDLYSQKSRVSFIQKVYNYLKLDKEQIKKDLYQIIDAIEKFQSDKNKPPVKEPIKISQQEKESALYRRRFI